jgi:hypothetical protein
MISQRPPFGSAHPDDPHFKLLASGKIEKVE